MGGVIVKYTTPENLRNIRVKKKKKMIFGLDVVVSLKTTTRTISAE